MSMLLLGRRASAGTKVAAPSAAPNSVVAEHGAERGERRRPAERLFERIHRQRADDAERPWERLMTPVTR